MNKNGTVMNKIEFIDLLPFNSYFIVSLETLKAHSGHNDGGGGDSLKPSNSKWWTNTFLQPKKKKFKEN